MRAQVRDELLPQQKRTLAEPASRADASPRRSCREIQLVDQEMGADRRSMSGLPRSDRRLSECR